MSRYLVIAANLGVVHEGSCPIQANAAWGEYKRQSVANYGRVAGETIVMLKGGDLIREHIGSLSED